MSSQASEDVKARRGGETVSPAEAALRKRILADPDFVLNDPELMRALLEPAQSAGRNVVDLRGALIQRLETKLGRLTEAHRDVVAAAWDNMTGMEQIHRAALAALEAESFERFVDVVSVDFATLLSVDAVRFYIGSDDLDAAAAASTVSSAATGASTDAVCAHPARPASALAPLSTIAIAAIAPPADRGTVTLKSEAGERPEIWGDAAGRIKSEAFVRLDLGARSNPALLAFGANDPKRFHPEQGDELLTFLGRVVQRALRDWLGLAGERSAP